MFELVYEELSTEISIPVAMCKISFTDSILDQFSPEKSQTVLSIVPRYWLGERKAPGVKKENQQSQSG
jgi:hypothetical protein